MSSKQRLNGLDARGGHRKRATMSRGLRSLCRESDLKRWHHENPQHPAASGPRGVRHKRRTEDSSAPHTPWLMHVVCLSCLLLVIVVLSLGLAQQSQNALLRRNQSGAVSNEVSEGVEKSQCDCASHGDVRNDNDDNNEKASVSAVIFDKDSTTNHDDHIIDNTNTVSKQTADLQSCPKTNSDAQTNKMPKYNYTYFDWIPGKPAGIHDPVDDRNFPYNRLSHFRPRSQLVDGLDVVSVELRKKSTAKGSSVRVYLLDDLMSDEECDALRHVHTTHANVLSNAPIVCFANIETLQHHLRHIGKTNIRVSENDFVRDTRCVNSSFSATLREWGLSWSTGTGFYPGENSFSNVLDRRIEKVTGLLSVNGGAYRIVSYLPSIGYKEHTDCSLQRHKGTEDRFATILFYLDDVDIGGHTYFPELGISVKPKKGRALVWNNMNKDGQCDSTSIHTALPVTKGTKYILQRWYYYDNFPGVSSRPPIPPIPRRLPNQGLVSCDEHRFGSCRMYDMWTYDVVTRW